METVNNFIMEFPEISSKVFREMDKLGEGLNTDDRLAYKIIKRLSKYFETGEGLHKNTKRIMFVIGREIAQAKEEFSRRKFQRETHLFSTLTVLDGGGKSVEFEVVDVLADVEELVEYRESERDINGKIARLATSDRDKVILKAWSDGYYETKDVARILANTFGGNQESHVRYINRFKEKCEKSISTIQQVLAS